MPASKRIDWMDFAHQLDKEREATQDRLPKGVRCSLTLEAYGFGGAEFVVFLSCKEADVHASGRGRTPAKALAEATTEFKTRQAEQARRPRLVVAEPKALPVRTLFDGGNPA